MFQNTNGTLVTWIMDQTAYRFWTYFGPSPDFWSTGPDWHLIAVHDIDRNGKPDLVFQILLMGASLLGP